MIDLGPPPLLFPTPAIIRPVEGGFWGSLDAELTRIGLPRGVRRAVAMEMRRVLGGRHQHETADDLTRWIARKTGTPAQATLGVWLLAGAPSFAPYSTTYTTTGTQTVSIPSGASTVTVECIGAGGGGFGSASAGGGGGGQYVSVSTYSVSGLTGVYISVPAASAVRAAGAACFAKENSSGGTTIASASGGGAGGFGSGGTGGTGGTGTVKHDGGAGQGGGGNMGGGGAGGVTSAGSAGSGGVGGAGGGGAAGAGGSVAVGNNYGGGGGASSSPFLEYGGAQGWLKLSWA